MHFNSSDEYSCGWLGHSCTGRQLLGSHSSGGAMLPELWAWQLYLQQPPTLPRAAPPCPSTGGAGGWQETLASVKRNPPLPVKKI